MAPLELEGHTLGERHRHFNSLVKVACSKTEHLEKIDYNDTDIENLIKIDVAGARRDVQYMLEVFKSEDMLYVSRAIRKSTWLVTDDQYSNIVNPTYLHEELFPYMTSKAKNKLLLAIRLNLLHESRVEAFYCFFETDIKTAQKWLPRCSMPFIEKVIKKNGKNITESIFKRLCEKSFEILKMFVQCEDNDSCVSRSNLKSAMFLLQNNTERFMDMVEKLESYNIPEFGKKFTRIIMRKCPERIINNFHKYCDHIDLSVFARYLKSDTIEDFFRKQKDDKKMKYWFTFEKIKHFVRYMPKENRFQFIKQMFIEKSDDADNDDMELSDDCLQAPCRSVAFKCCALTSPSYRPTQGSSYAQIYRWYRYAPFPTAFSELTKIIRMEPSPAERNSMLTILLYSAACNQEHIKTLLQHFRSKHINEPFKFKIQFINILLSQTDAYKFDENSWNILNDIFSSMEVYMDSDNSVPICSEVIIVRNVLKDQDIPEIVVNKFKFNTLKRYRKKLDATEQNKLFSYLLQYLQGKQSITNDIKIIKDILTLLKDWDKNIKEYLYIIGYIKEYIKLKKIHTLDVDLQSLYNVQKSWRKDMFDVSLILNPTDDACVNALKHDPSLLSCDKTNVAAILLKDAISLKKVNRKLRIYWLHSLAREWCDFYLERIDGATGHQAIVEGICSLLPRDQALALVEKYAPIDSKIDWCHTSSNDFNLRKNFASKMYIIRPPVNIETVLLYSKEDYLQYSLPSLSSILHNMSSDKVSSCFLTLIYKPVSLQKHGIRIAFKKLKLGEIKELFINTWKNTTNSTIKTVLFQQTHKLLVKEKNEIVINEIWELMSVFIENLSKDESKTIYTLLTDLENIPSQLQGKLFMKSYMYLKALSSKVNPGLYLRNLEKFAPDIIDSLEPSFIEDVLLKSLRDLIVKHNIVRYSDDQINLTLQILSAYLLSSKTEEIQNAMYERVLSPLIDHCLASWKLRKENEFMVNKNFHEVLGQLTRDLTAVVVTKKAIIPVQMFKNIQTKLRSSLTPVNDYSILVKINVLTLFVEALGKYMQSMSTTMEVNNEKLDYRTNECLTYEPGWLKDTDAMWGKVCDGVAPLFGIECMNYFKQDSMTHRYPCLYSLTTKVLRRVLFCLKFTNVQEYKMAKAMLSDQSIAICYYIAVSVMKNCGDYGDIEAIRNEICQLVSSHPAEEIKLYFNDFYYSANIKFEE